MQQNLIIKECPGVQQKNNKSHEPRVNAWFDEESLFEIELCVRVKVQQEKEQTGKRENNNRVGEEEDALHFEKGEEHNCHGSVEGLRDEHLKLDIVRYGQG